MQIDQITCVNDDTLHAVSGDLELHLDAAEFYTWMVSRSYFPFGTLIDKSNNQIAYRSIAASGFNCSVIGFDIMTRMLTHQYHALYTPESLDEYVLQYIHEHQIRWQPVEEAPDDTEAINDAIEARNNS